VSLWVELTKFMLGMHEAVRSWSAVDKQGVVVRFENGRLMQLTTQCLESV
jgi:hypothetical protein